MALTVTSRRFPDEQAGAQDQNGRRAYVEVFEVDQTDAGSLAAGVAVAAAAQAVMSGDPLPERGDNYSYGGTTDLDAFALSFAWRRPFPVEYPKRWHITVNYGPPDNINEDRLNETDPLLWPTEYWVEWVEEQEVIEKARVVEDLSHVDRAADSEGPIINACGEETIEPQMKTVRYPILHCQKAYATLEEIIDLNVTYQDTTNDDTFFDAPARTAKYLGTESGRLQRAGGISFYMGITQIQFRDKTWDRVILNNGWNHFELDGGGPDYVEDADGKPKLIKNLVFDDPDDDEKDIESSEPLNLAMDGTLLPTDTAATKITYRYLAEVDYAGIGIGG